MAKRSLLSRCPTYYYYYYYYYYYFFFYLFFLFSLLFELQLLGLPAFMYVSSRQLVN